MASGWGLWVVLTESVSIQNILLRLWCKDQEDIGSKLQNTKDEKQILKLAGKRENLLQGKTIKLMANLRAIMEAIEQYINIFKALSENYSTNLCTW